MAADIEYLLTLGLTIEDIAERAGRTPTAIQHELETYRENLKKEEHN